MKIIIKDVELVYEDGEVVFDADIEVEIDEDTGEKTVSWAYAKEDVPHPNWNLKTGDRFDPGDSINIDELFETDLDTPLDQVFTAREAEQLYGLATNTVAKWCQRERFLPDEYKKSGRTWLVTKKGMDRLTKRNKGEE